MNELEFVSAKCNFSTLIKKKNIRGRSSELFEISLEQKKHDTSM